MEAGIVKQIAVTPYFELEDFMNFSKETRLDNSTLKNLTDLWERWSGDLCACQISSPNTSWAVIWLPEKIGEEIDIAWSREPARGFLMNCLAQYLCMSAVGELVPQAAFSGCAPTPGPDKVLRSSLNKLGLATEDGTLTNRYAVVTYFPFKGGCEICGISENCPKKTTEENFSSIVLPGHEM